MKNSLLIYLFFSFSVVAGPVDDHKPFAKEINNDATDSIKTGIHGMFQTMKNHIQTIIT